MERFVDRRVIVSGAGSGIGRATVLRILEEGGTVTAFDVSEGGLKETAASVPAEEQRKRLATAVLDVSVEAEVIRAVDSAIADMGGLEGLVNAAGIQLSAHTHEHSLSDWERTIAVNLTGTFLMTRQALPALCESGRGVVVNFTSTSAQFAHPYMAAYAASKGGILSFTHGLALEYAAQGLRAVNIQPGGISSGLSSRVIESMPEGWNPSLWAKQSPLLNGGKLGDPRSVAAVVAMVASDDGASVTGTELRVDGGAHA